MSGKRKPKFHRKSFEEGVRVGRSAGVDITCARVLAKSKDVRKAAIYAYEMEFPKAKK